MKKTTLIIIVALVILGFLMLLSALLTNRSKPSNQTKNPTPTRIQTQPTLKRNTYGTKISILSTEPQHNQKEVSASASIRIKFDQAPSQEKVTFSIDPQSEYSETYEDKMLVITPKTSWNPGTTYTYSIKLNGPNFPYVFTFQTAGPTTAYPKDTYPKGAFEENNAFLLESAPEAYVANKTPYENQYFSINYRFKDQSSGQIEFVVVKKVESEETVRSEVKKWLTSLGLKENQIQSIKITFE